MGKPCLRGIIQEEKRDDAFSFMQGNKGNMSYFLQLLIEAFF